MSKVKFVGGPPSAPNRIFHKGIAEELRANPGEWALVCEEVNSGVAVSIRTGYLSAYKPAGSFEAVSRNNRVVEGRHRADIYARYVGEVPA